MIRHRANKTDTGQRGVESEGERQAEGDREGAQA